MDATSAASEICFGPYRLDAANARLLRDGRPLALAPKALDLLHLLASRPQRLVTKDELLSKVWPNVIVSDASVKVCIREIRKVLQDTAKTPTYIETVHRRGYRFIASVKAGQPAIQMAEHATPSSVATVGAEQPALVGRDEELRRLAELYSLAREGRRQCVVISGGPGSGKTALAEAFIRGVSDGATTVLAGHCFQQFGTSEPYMPLWEALGRLARERPSPPLVGLLARHAAAQVAPAAPPTAPGPSQPAAEPRAMSERLLREIADVVEALAADAPLLLLVEDLHWADYSTIDLLSALARRRSPARLMVVATYRPAEVLAAEHPEHPLRGVVRELITAGLCREVALGALDEPAVARYLAGRFPGGHLSPALPRRLHQRTEGHPLFLVHVVDDLVEQGVIVPHAGGWELAGALADTTGATIGNGQAPGLEEGQAAWLAVLDTQIPQTVRAMIELHLERLDRPAREALEAAAVAGVEFSAAAVAAALGADVVEAERLCDDLARRHRFLAPHGLAEWPDGVVATHYRFVHELYHNVVYEQIPAARRARMHRALGLRLESAWGGRAAEEAAGLAMHFETARDWARAVKYLRHAAHAAARQYAHREAAHYLSRALAALDRLPEAERAPHELDVLQRLGVNLQVTRGFAAHQVEAIHARAYALCQQRVDDSTASAGAGRDIATTFPVLWGIWVFRKVRSDLHRARAMCVELLEMARQSTDPALLLQAHQAMCVTHLCLGAPEVTREHMEQAAAIYDPQLHARNTDAFGQDPGVATQAFGAVALWLLGRPREALAASERSLELAAQLGQPSSVAVATHFTGMLHQLRGDAATVSRLAQAAVDLAAEQGFSFWHAGGQVLRGWARVALAAGGAGAAKMMNRVEGDIEVGLAEIRSGLDAWLATGSRTYHSYYLGLLADALQRVGCHRQALRPLDEALAAAQLLPEGLYEAELYRLRARSVRGASTEGVIRESLLRDADDCLAKALAVARAQGARWFELRAATDLASSLRRRGRTVEADDLLATTTARFESLAAWQGQGSTGDLWHGPALTVPQV